MGFGVFLFFFFFGTYLDYWSVSNGDWGVSISRGGISDWSVSNSWGSISYWSVCYSWGISAISIGASVRRCVGGECRGTEVAS